MPFAYSDSLKFFCFDIFQGTDIVHGVFTRQGGVSPAPWSSLNTGGLSGDSRENVIENRRRIFSVFNRPVETIFDVWQVHSADVIRASHPRPLDEPHHKADAIITDQSNVTLFMRFGDCVPILLNDPIRRVVAIAHAGWQGTVQKIVQATVRAMISDYGCKSENILAGIGPSICVDHYEFGGDPLVRVKESFREQASEVLLDKDGRTYFDLWKANRVLLSQAGLKEEHIQVSGLCTAENCQDWYSHRAEKGKTGRFGALLALK